MVGKINIKPRSLIDVFKVLVFKVAILRHLAVQRGRLLALLYQGWGLSGEACE